MGTETRTPAIAVVIPFYQAEAGILRETVDAILLNSKGISLQVIVADDGSPVPAEKELADLIDQDAPVKVVRQDNAGPGAARNTALDNVPDGCPYVALVDSDDRWVANLLGDAVAALEQGYDLFFGNSRRIDIPGTRFDWQKEEGLSLRAGDHQPIGQNGGLHAFTGDFFDFIVRRSNILGPSTLVYRLSCAPELRYSETIFNGQDRLFKLHLARNVHRVAFSPRVYAEEGRGVNIFDSAGWGTGKSLRFLSSYIDLAKTILREVPLNSEQQRFVRNQLRTSRFNFAVSLAHLIRHGGDVNRTIVRKTFRNDPTTLLLLGPNIARAVLGKMIGRAS